MRNFLPPFNVSRLSTNFSEIAFLWTLSREMHAPVLKVQNDNEQVD